MEYKKIIENIKHINILKLLLQIIKFHTFQHDRHCSALRTFSFLVHGKKKSINCK